MKFNACIVVILHACGSASISVTFREQQPDALLASANVHCTDNHLPRVEWIRALLLEWIRCVPGLMTHITVQDAGVGDLSGETLHFKKRTKRHSYEEDHPSFNMENKMENMKIMKNMDSKNSKNNKNNTTT